MLKRFSANYMALFLLVDTALIQVALLVALALRYRTPIGQPWPHDSVESARVWLHLAVAALGLVCLVGASAYNPRKVVRWIDEAQRVVLGTTAVCLTLTGALYLMNVELPRLGFLYFFLLSTALLVGYRLLARAVQRAMQRHAGVVSRVLIVGASKAGMDVAEELARRRLPGVELAGFLDDGAQLVGGEVCGLPVLGLVSDAREVVTQQGIDEVLVALPLHAHEKLVNLVAVLYELPVRVRVVPDIFDLAFHNASIESLGGILFIGLRDPAIEGVQYLVKRLMDLILSAIGLLLLSPLFAVVALAIKLEDGGRVFYKSQRVGENGKLFWMWKFRSMTPDAESKEQRIDGPDGRGPFLHKTQDDPRITRVGRILRRTSIDELPQLFNVLRGDMSLVGPRPELPWMVAQYELWQRKRFAVPQGMTGWWQINGRSDMPLHLFTEHDLYYIQNYSLWLDLRILWKTIAVIVSGKGAY